MKKVNKEQLYDLVWQAFTREKVFTEPDGVELNRSLEARPDMSGNINEVCIKRLH